MFCVAALAACTNLAAVRDFTKQSSDLAGYTDTTSFMVSNPHRLLREAPASGDFSPARDNLKAAVDERARHQDSIVRIHDVVAGYMGALAGLAGDKAFSVSSGISKVQGALTASDTFGIKKEAVDAYAGIASKVADWIAEAIQEREVKAMVGKYGDSMDVMLGSLVDVSNAMVRILQEDQKKMVSFNEYYEGGFRRDLGPEQPPPANLGADERRRYEDQMNTARLRREAERVVVMRSNAASAEEQQKAVASAKAAAAGAMSVQAGHAEMRKNIDRLTNEQTSARLQQLAADIHAVLGNLKKLQEATS
ncbi:hypothetical protein A8M77_12880 [Variovorax sp. JS1663]|nr:hypothetical protein A8M77_12880 [Variovorax sp. JS1663]